MSRTQFELPRNPLTVLSRREGEVLQLVTCDLKDREIACRLGIGERTVRAHVSRIILKLGVSSRVGAAVAFVVWSMRAGLAQCGSSDMAEEPMETFSVSVSG